MTIGLVGDPESNGATLAEAIAPTDDDAQGITARLINYLNGLLGGTRNGKYLLTVEAVTSTKNYADGTVTITHASVSAGDTWTLGGLTLTWAVAAADENEITIGASATADATNMKNAINAHSVLGKFFSATSSAGVVTVQCRLPGKVGSLMEWATSDAAAMALSPAATLGNVTATFSQSPITVHRGVG